MSEAATPELFMCAVDYEHHLYSDPRGTRVFESLEDLREARPCVATCGIVAVRVELVRYQQESDYSGLRASLPVKEGE